MARVGSLKFYVPEDQYDSLLPICHSERREESQTSFNNNDTIESSLT